MQWPSYPWETPDQWPPIEGNHSDWGGACNQSINTGLSLGERYNLMRHTDTSPFIWLPPPFCPLPKLLVEAFLHVLFLLSLLLPSPVFYHSLYTSLSLNALLFSPSCPLPLLLTSLKFQGDGTHKSKECSWAGVEEGGEDNNENRVEAVGGWGSSRLMAQEQDGFLWLSYSLVFTGLRSELVWSSDEVVSVLDFAWWVI